MRINPRHLILCFLCLFPDHSAAFDLDGIRSGMTDLQIMKVAPPKSSFGLDISDGLTISVNKKPRYAIHFCDGRSYLIVKFFDPSTAIATALVEQNIKEYGSPRVSTNSDILPSGEVKQLIFDFPRMGSELTRIMIITQIPSGNYTTSLSKMDDAICVKK